MITTCFSQKGIEFDPFELRIIQCLPHTKSEDRLLTIGGEGGLAEVLVGKRPDF